MKWWRGGRPGYKNDRPFKTLRKQFLVGNGQWAIDNKQTMNSESSLNRFIDAQDKIYAQVVKELQGGRKTSHWMLFIFPQIDGLGQSPTAKYYSIKNIDEAKEYLAHPVLGKRLIECAGLILQVKDRTANDIFGYPDDMKLRSSMTLFNFVAPEQKVFSEVLKKFYKRAGDEKTLELIHKNK
jgi:uncharacterized protein (DUF1810 family)